MSIKQLTKSKLYRIEKPHAEGCACARGKWHNDYDWFWPHYNFKNQPNALWLDAAGTKRGSTYKWLRLICPAGRGCGAVLLVNLAELERAISAVVRKETRKQ